MLKVNVDRDDDDDDDDDDGIEWDVDGNDSQWYTLLRLPEVGFILDNNNIMILGCFALLQLFLLVNSKLNMTEIL